MIEEWRFAGQTTDGEFDDLDCVIAARGLNPNNRLLFAPAAGLTCLLGKDDNVYISFDYEGEFAFDGTYYDHQGTLQIGYDF